MLCYDDDDDVAERLVVDSYDFARDSSATATSENEQRIDTVAVVVNKRGVDQ